MAADSRTDAVNLDLATHLGEALLDEIRHRTRVLHAIAFADEDGTVIIEPLVGGLLHLLDNALDDLLLRADLFARNEASERIHVKERTNAEHRAHKAAQRLHATALDIEGEIRGEKPVPIMELVSLGPLAQLVEWLHAFGSVSRKAPA